MSTTNLTMLARNRLRLTQQSLRSLWACTGSFNEWNIVILDDRSDEPTARLLNTYGTMRNDTPMGTGSLRNAVVAESERRHGRGDYLYLADNDTVYLPGWLEKLITAYEYAWTYGFRVIGAYNHPYNQAISWLGKEVYEVNHLASQSMLMKWEVWDQFGPFVDTPVDKVCQSEDVVFSENIRAAGFKVGVVSPWLVHNCGITNSFGEHIPGWQLVKSQCPAGILCE